MQNLRSMKMNKSQTKGIFQGIGRGLILTTIILVIIGVVNKVNIWALILSFFSLMGCLIAIISDDDEERILGVE